MSTLTETQTRIRTAVIAAAVFLTLVTYGGSFGASFCSAVIAGVVCYELFAIFFSLPDKKEKLIALIGTTWLTVFINVFFPRTLLECLIASFVGMFTYYLATAERHAENLKRHFEEFVFSVFILVYIVTFVSFLPLIRQSMYGLHWTLLFFFLTWAGETGAYFVGRKFGKTKLYPLISPGKTVEGAAGGLLAGLVVAFLYKIIFFRGMSWAGVFIVPIVVGVVSQIGDLCESLIKRAYGLKDIGNILPGHGGLLDRFDGVIFSLPTMYLCARLFTIG